MARRIQPRSTEWEFIDNAEEGENCGTGAGGFKKGNTCAKGGNRLIRQEILDERDRQNRMARESNQPWLKASGHMGSFPDEYLTSMGKKIMEASKRFIGSKGAFRGFSKDGMYIKYQLKNDEDEDNISVFRDWLEDEGIDVRLERKTGQRTVDRRRNPDAIFDVETVNYILVHMR